MKLKEIQEILGAATYGAENLEKAEAYKACGSDLLSDVLAFTKERTLLLTGLVHPQVIRTAEMLDLVGVVLVRGKEPSQEMIDLARSKKIPLMSTAYPMFESCGLLYKAGLGGNNRED